MEKELSRKIDLGFEHSLIPIAREKVKGQILYVRKGYLTGFRAYSLMVEEM